MDRTVRPRSASRDGGSRRARPDAALVQRIAELRANGRPQRGAIFIPTERLFYSQVKSPMALQLLSLPSTFHTFADYLVNHGFRVVVTTHALTVLYALNNLVLASALPAGPLPGVPEPEVRLQPATIAAYLLRAGEPASSIVDRASGFMSEAELGRAGEELSEQMNRIGMLARRAPDQGR